MSYPKARWFLISSPSYLAPPVLMFSSLQQNCSVLRNTCNTSGGGLYIRGYDYRKSPKFGFRILCPNYMSTVGARRKGLIFCRYLRISPEAGLDKACSRQAYECIELHRLFYVERPSVGLANLTYSPDPLSDPKNQAPR